MPSPKSGKAGSAVSPAESKAAEEADVAQPGAVEKVKTEQRAAKSGKYGSVKTQPHKPPQTQEEAEQKKSWIEIEMVGEDGEPLPGVRYEITLPDDTVASGSLDEQGLARIEGIEPGTCRISFPDLDEAAWKRR
jgi:hypothetical protein